MNLKGKIKDIKRTVKDQIFEMWWDYFRPSYLPQPCMEEIINVLTDLPGHLRIITHPVKAVYKLSYYLTDGKADFYYCFVAENDKLDGFQYMDDNQCGALIVESTPAQLIKRYKLDTMVIEKNFKPAYRHIHDLKIIFENKKYIVGKMEEGNGEN